MLTQKQYQLLLYIDKHLKQTGYSPSFDEMKDALSLRSKSGIHRLISALEDRGFLRRHHHRARALEVLKIPALEQSVPEKQKSVLPENVLQGVFSEPQRAHEMPAMVSVPLLGRIAAGLPIEAVEQPDNSVDVPISMLAAGKHYALVVSGDSMVDIGIHDGDTAIIQECQSADNGQIVVALVDQHEVTLKTFRRHGRSVALEPANSAYETQIFSADRVRIQGRLKTIMRHYV
ncbi:LexA repressor [Neokomagataea thailandica NBRC 106555]|uniref:LexA repressor n=2 Tax=Neokomagataea TaxID=1223423 RepID=A0A4Y6V8D2_9PROT|nr:MULTISPECIES: transcriptional repressor LexA [Neokomagataea]QDH25604.1 transcriptional repressor LexA [Neokomagataea tanensis]GBR52563.1 LexA repressor [Neokomagataea thailandica NBRC 106555]